MGTINRNVLLAGMSAIAAMSFGPSSHLQRKSAAPPAPKVKKMKTRPVGGGACIISSRSSLKKRMRAFRRETEARNMGRSSKVSLGAGSVRPYHD